MSAPQVHRGARARVLRGDGVSGGHGGPGDVVLGPLSLACGRVMGMMKRGARVDVKVSYVALGVGSRAERSGTICLAF